MPHHLYNLRFFPLSDLPADFFKRGLNQYTKEQKKFTTTVHFYVQGPMHIFENTCIYLIQALLEDMIGKPPVVQVLFNKLLCESIF